MVWQDTGAGLISGLEHSLIGEGATAGHDANLSWLVDVPLQAHSMAQHSTAQQDTGAGLISGLEHSLMVRVPLRDTMPIFPGL
jgi:hypothetical protein